MLFNNVVLIPINRQNYKPGPSVGNYTVSFMAIITRSSNYVDTRYDPSYDAVKHSAWHGVGVDGCSSSHVR